MQGRLGDEGAHQGEPALGQFPHQAGGQLRQAALRPAVAQQPAKGPLNPGLTQVKLAVRQRRQFGGQGAIGLIHEHQCRIPALKM